MNNFLFSTLILMAGCGATESSTTTTALEANTLRSSVIDHLWAGAGLPTSTTPTELELETNDSRLSITGTVSVDRVTIVGDYGLPSHWFHYRPGAPNGRLVIYHDGHCDNCTDTEGAIQHLLDNGFSVLWGQMPLYGDNQHPDFTRNLRHNDFYAMEWEDENIVRIFLTPVAIALNYVTANFWYYDISMMGLSGGGWTTTVYAAIDRRVRLSIPIAGSLPVAMRVSGEYGDFEQDSRRPLYDVADYEDLYFLGAAGTLRQQVQILNENDTCCFSSDGREAEIFKYGQTVQERVLRNQQGGSFSTWVVKDQSLHKVTEATMELVDLILGPGIL